MSARHPALLLTTAIMLAIVMGFIAYSSSALGRDALDDLFDEIVREEDAALIRERLHTYQHRCKVRVAMNGVGFPVVVKVLSCNGGGR